MAESNSCAQISFYLTNRNWHCVSLPCRNRTLILHCGIRPDDSFARRVNPSSKWFPPLSLLAEVSCDRDKPLHKRQETAAGEVWAALNTISGQAY